jgi:cell volume regulation protein A
MWTTLSIDYLILTGAILLLLSILASKTSGKLGVPSLLLFMAIGMLAGADGPGGIDFSNTGMAQFMGVFALIMILFSGGLDTRWESVKPVLWKGVLLSTLGVMITAGVVGLFVWQFTGFSLVEGLLLGAIISSTDAAAVFSILRSKNIGLKGRLRPLLELESGSNDPMAFFLTITLVQIALLPDTSFWDGILSFLLQMSVGALAGYLMGKAMNWILNHIKLDYDGLYPVLLLGLVLFTYALTSFLKGNGFLAVYIAAVILGNRNFIHKRSILKFFDGQAWLMQIVMFLALGLLVYPSRIIPVIGIGLLVSVVLIFVARPLGVFISLHFFKMQTREKILISWVGLRGAVPIIFATYPLMAGLVKADIIFNIVFFVVLTSVALQGTTLSVVAKWLALYREVSPKRRYPLELELTDGFHNELVEVSVPPECSAVGKSLVELNFPKNTLIVMIERDKKYITPNGATILEPGDNLLVMTDSPKDLASINSCLGIKRI